MNRIEHVWGERTPYGRGARWPERVDMHLAEGVGEVDVERWVPTASLLHSNGDAMGIAVRDGRIVGVRGRHALDAVESNKPGKAPALLLLEDLRELYLPAPETSLAWEMLAQHAQAKRESDLLKVTEQCHPQTLRQVRWANSMIKILSPQALASLDA